MDGGESTGFLPTLTLEEAKFDREDILRELCLEERLPEFMQVVFWCCQDIRKVLILLLELEGRRVCREYTESYVCDPQFTSTVY